MFMLFTTPALPPGGAREGVLDIVGAIKDGAARSGADFTYLLGAARQESALDPQARSSSSTASGLFQFVEQTWLKTLKDSGPKLGLARFANAVVETKPGHFDVPDPVMRDAILKLRSDPRTSSLMAGALTHANAAALSGALGHAPASGDLYLAHVLGVTSASELVKAIDADPGQSAAAKFPEAARANPSLFYSHDGQPRSVAELRAFVAHLHESAASRPLPSHQTSPAESDSIPMAYANPDGPALFSLFRNVGPVAPLNSVVESLWSDDQKIHFNLDSSATVSGTGPMTVPLPPVRPAMMRTHIGSGVSYPDRFEREESDD
jgi:Transglycosylase SLT domain